MLLSLPLLFPATEAAAMFCWLLAIFLLGLALGLSDGGKLARLVTFLTPEEAGVDPDDPGVDPADEV